MNHPFLYKEMDFFSCFLLYKLKNPALLAKAHKKGRAKTARP
jgi:hypothetical protein